MEKYKKVEKSEALLIHKKNEESLINKTLKAGLPLSTDELLQYICHLEKRQVRKQLIIEELELAKEEAAKIAAEKYADLYQSATIGHMTLSKEGEIIALNLFASQILGNEYAVTKNSSFRLFVSDDTKPQFDFFLSKVFSNSTSEKCEVSLSLNSSLPVFIQLTGKAHTNEEHCLVTAIDITDRKRVEEALTEANLRFWTLFENGPIGVAYHEMIYDASGKPIDYRFVDTNESYRELTGIDPRGKTVKQAFPGIENDIFDWIGTYGHVARNGKSIRFEQFLQFNDRWYDCVAYQYKPNHFVTAFLEITKRKRAEEALKKSELMFRTVADQTFDWVYWIGEDQQIIYMSPASKNITGYDPEEFISNPQLLQKIIHPSDNESILHHQKQVISDKNRNEAFDLEMRVISKNGSLVWINHICRPIYDENGKYLGRRICNRDITERKESEKQLKLLSRAIEQSQITVIITDMKGDIQYANPKFTEQTGYEFEEVKGKNPRFLQSGEQSVKFYEELWNTILSGNVWNGELHNKKKNGDSYWESTVISAILNSKGEITFFLAVKEDITEKKKMIADLILAKEKAEESDRLKSAFLANMSHEIRTPMNGIMGFTELLKEPNLSGNEQQEYIHIIQKSGTRMLNIINDIISISKVESGQMDVYITDTNVNMQIDYLYTFFKPEAEQKGLQLFFRKHLSSNEANLKTDKEKIYAILTNLVKNAIKFTPMGSIEFGYERKGKYLEFFVKDTGPGIRQEQMDFIFERFRQGSESLSRSYEGAGLGLTISKAFVEMLGGKIWVESSEGIGSVFYFTIPYIVKINEYNLSENIVSADEENQIKNLKILISEDDHISSVLLNKAVKNISKEILIVKNGIEAVEACHDNPDIDLILMDIKMPLMDGYEATRFIRKFNTNVVIIAQSAFALIGDQEKAIASGCNDYISKPIIKERLTELINKHFKK